MNKRHPVSTTRQRGISLILVLILTVVIGLTAAAAMRGATSSQRVTNNVRMDNMAQQYAEAALRYCETQLQQLDAARVNSLKDAVIPGRGSLIAGVVPPAAGHWENPVSWGNNVNAGAAAATRTSLTTAQISTAGISSYLPPKNPECVVETQTVGSPTFTITVVTARGFSSNYRDDGNASGNGNTTSGSVVWLQSILNL